MASTLNVPPQEKAKIRNYKYFKGVDFTSEYSSNINASRSPWSVNMYRNYQSGEVDEQGIQTRPGIGQLIDFGKNIEVHNIIEHEYTKYILTNVGGIPVPQTLGTRKIVLVHAGTNLYRWVNYPSGATLGSANLVLVSSSLANNKSCYVAYGNLMFIIDGATLWQYSDMITSNDVITDSLIEEEGTVPITYINRQWYGGGEAYQAVNRLTGKFINQFVGDGVNRTFYLSSTALKSVLQVVVRLGNSANYLSPYEYSVNLIIGTVTITTANPPDDDEIVEVWASKENGSRNSIVKAKVIENFDNRIFVGGSPEPQVGVLYYSALNSPAYFPDINYAALGHQASAIAGFIPMGERLAVLKAEKSVNTAIYYLAPLETDNDLLPKIYPVAESTFSTGILSENACMVFNDDPVFLTSEGLMGISKIDISQERSISSRSSTINSYLKTVIADAKNKIGGLVPPSIVKWRGYLLILIDGKIFLADSRQRYINQETQSVEYEWFYWDSIYSYRSGNFKLATSLHVYDDFLFVLTADGTISRFYDTSSKDGNNEYIQSCWATPHDNFDSPAYFKTTNKRGGIAKVRDQYNHTKLRVKANTMNYMSVAKYSYGTFLFDSDNISEPVMLVRNRDNLSYRIKAKKWTDISLLFYSTTGMLALQSATLEAYIKGYAKIRPEK